MCGGSVPSPQAAKIKKPKQYAARKAQKVMGKAIRQVISPKSDLALAQMNLQQSDKDLADTLQQVRDLKLDLADNQSALSEQAMRMSALMGPPPPEESAKPPLTGRDRDESPNRRRGRSSLRVDRVTTSGSSSGAGLSIT